MKVTLKANEKNAIVLLNNILRTILMGYSVYNPVLGLKIFYEFSKSETDKIRVLQQFDNDCEVTLLEYANILNFDKQIMFSWFVLKGEKLN